MASIITRRPTQRKGAEATRRKKRLRKLLKIRKHRGMPRVNP